MALWLLIWKPPHPWIDVGEVGNMVVRADTEEAARRIGQDWGGGERRARDEEPRREVPCASCAEGQAKMAWGSCSHSETEPWRNPEKADCELLDPNGPEELICRDENEYEP